MSVTKNKTMKIRTTFGLALFFGSFSILFAQQNTERKTNPPKSTAPPLATKKNPTVNKAPATFIEDGNSAPTVMSAKMKLEPKTRNNSKIATGK